MVNKSLFGVVMFLIVAVAAGCEAPKRTAWLGLNTRLFEPVPATQPADAACLRANFEVIGEMKVPIIRDALMNWGAIQPRPDGPYDFAAVDDYVRAAQHVNADVLVVFRGIPGWASLDYKPGSVMTGLPPRQHVQAFTAFVEKFVERYDNDTRLDMPKLQGGIHTYQFLSEMEDIPPAEYAYWLKLFYQAVKRANPRTTVVLGALSSPGVRMFDQSKGGCPQYLEHLLANSELEGPGYPYFDVAAFDNFPNDYPGRSPFDEALAYLRQTLADHSLTVPIWLTAYGDHSVSNRQAEQADSIVKWTVKARAIGIERAYLYCLQDCRNPRLSGPQDFGLIGKPNRNGQPSRKPAFTAFGKLIAQVGERPHITMRSQGLYVLTGKGNPSYIIWKEESYDPIQMFIPGWWTVETLTGVKAVRQGSEIRLTTSPQILQRTTSPFIK